VSAMRGARRRENENKEGDHEGERTTETKKGAGRGHSGAVFRVCGVLP
jgi:hypothetical protein